MYWVREGVLSQFKRFTELFPRIFSNIMRVLSISFVITFMSSVTAHPGNLSVNFTNLTDSVMNRWRAPYKKQMGALIECIKQ